MTTVVGEWNWPELIRRYAEIRRENQRRDVDHLYEYPPPNDPATPQMIEEVERYLGEPLDPCYRSFLLCVNGWYHVSQDLDLFGTVDIRGGGRMSAAHRDLEEREEDEVFDDFVIWSRDSREPIHLDVSPADLLPVGLNVDSHELATIARRRSPLAGSVVSFGHTDNAVYQDFAEYFTKALIDVGVFM